MEEDLVDLGVTDQPDRKNGGGFRRLGVLVGSLCAVAWGLFAVYVFFKEKVTLSNIGFFLFLFLLCFPAYFLPYMVLRAIGRMVGETPEEQED
jgi:hypothetical protein